MHGQLSPSALAQRLGAEASEDVELLLAALRLVVSGVGECRLEAPYASLRPVLDGDGLRWCCTHACEHCWPPTGSQGIVAA